MEGARKRQLRHLLSFFFFFFFFFFAPLLPSPPASCRYLSPLLRVVWSVQQVSAPPQYVRCYSCSLSFPIFLHHILQNTCRLFLPCLIPFPFVLFFVLFVCLFVSFVPPFFMVWLVLLCYRTRYASIHLLYLDEMRLFGLLRFTVCDHIISVCLG